MATVINQPFKRTILSAEGSAEVLGRGTNDYTTNYLRTDHLSYLDNWSLWDNFPTAVRFGNFVFVLSEYIDNRFAYQLIDVVPDPEVENQFGNNIAYPQIEEFRYFDGTNILGDGSEYTWNLDTTIEEGLYPKLSVTTITQSNSTEIGGTVYPGYDIDDLILEFTDGTISGARIHHGSVSRHILFGWGDYAILDGTPAYQFAHIFAPFASKEQFETVYGKESDWISELVNSGTPRWLFEAPSGSSYQTVAFPNGTSSLQSFSEDSRTYYYPFTVEEMTPNTLYKDIAGDNNGDGIDNSTSFEDALATYATAASIFPGLDITKCGNLADLSIKLPGIDLPSINELKNSVKAGIDSAVSSTGLLKLGEKLEGFKAGLIDELPKVPQIENLAKDISDLKDAGEDKLSELKEKWENAVDDIESIIDNVRNLGGFDVCQFVTDKAKTDEDGNLVKKNDVPTVPEGDIEEFERGVMVPQSNAQLPQDEVQQSTGIVEAAAREARVEYDSIWKKILQDPFIYEANTNDITFKEKTLQQQISEMVSTTDGRVGAQNVGLSLSDSEISISDIMGIKKDSDPQSTVNSDPLKVKVPDGVGYKNKQALISRKEQLLKDPNYQKLKTSGSGFTISDVPLRLTEFEIFAKNYRIEFTDKLIVSAREQISAKLFKSNDIESISAVTDSQSTELWSPPEYIKAGAIYPNSISAIVTENEVELFKKITTIIHTFIDNNICTEEVLQLAVTITSGTISANTERNTNQGAGDTMLPSLTPEGEKGSAGIRGERGDATFEANVSLKAVSYKDITGSVIYDYSSGTIRNKPVQPELLSILEKTSNQGGYKFVIYSGGQDVAGRGNRRTGSKRHDAGYAADIRVYNKNGRRISAAGNSRDINELQDCVVLLLQNGISSVGAHRYYMNGNLHVDISNRGPWGIGPAIWGNNHRSNTAPQWLRNIFY